MAFPLALAALGIPNAALGAWQTYQSIKGLKELQKQPVPNFTVAPELRNAYTRAQQMAQRGFTGGEEAAFKSNLASQTAGAEQSVRNQMGGNLAGNVFAGIQARNIGALNKFAAQDADLQRNNIRYADSIGSAIQQQENMATQSNIQRRIAQEQAFGAGLKSGTGNIVGGVNYGLSMLSPDIAKLGMGRTMAPSAGDYDPRPASPQASYSASPGGNDISADASEIYSRAPVGYSLETTPEEDEIQRRRYSTTIPNFNAVY